MRRSKNTTYPTRPRPLAYRLPVQPHDTAPRSSVASLLPLPPRLDCGQTGHAIAIGRTCDFSFVCNQDHNVLMILIALKEGIWA